MLHSERSHAHCAPGLHGCTRARGNPLRGLILKGGPVAARMGCGQRDWAWGQTLRSALQRPRPCPHTCSQVTKFDGAGGLVGLASPLYRRSWFDDSDSGLPISCFMKFDSGGWQVVRASGRRHRAVLFRCSSADLHVGGSPVVKCTR